MVNTTAGLQVIIGLGGANVALLTSVDLTWKQAYKRFYPCGSLVPQAVLAGPIAYDGKFTHAFINTGFLGSFNTGTNTFIGTVFPVGGTNPLVAGTILLSGGALRNMKAESVEAVEQDNSFLMYNMTFTN